MNTYLVYAISPLPNWILVLIAIDRFLSISKPTKFMIRKKAKFQVIASISLILFDILYYVPIIFFSDIPDLYKNQTVPYTNLISICKPEKFYNWFITFHTVEIPFIIMIIFTILTVNSLFKSRRNSSTTKSTLTKSKDTRFAITSITLNLLFFVLSFPLSMYLILKNFVLLDVDVDYLLSSLFGVLFYFNNAVLLYTNLIVNSTFRNEFKLFFNELKLKLFVNFWN